MDKQELLSIYGTADYKSLTRTERTVFKDLVEALMERCLFNTADIPIIAGYARNVVLARTAARDVERLGTVIEFQDRGFKKYKANPAIDVMRKAQTAYEDTAVKLGLTPTGRKRLNGEAAAGNTLDPRIGELLAEAAREGIFLPPGTSIKGMNAAEVWTLLYGAG